MKSDRASGLLAVWALSQLACATHRPCSETSDTTWVNPIRGNRTCQQKKLPNGDYVNDGLFTIWDPDSRKILLEGRFKNGKKEGYWVQYDPKGNKIVERYFENGVDLGGAKPGAGTKAP